MYKNEIKHIVLTHLYKHKYQSFSTRKVFFACGIPRSDGAIYEKVIAELADRECVSVENSTIHWNTEYFLAKCCVFGTRYYAYNDGEKYRLSFGESLKPLDGDWIVAKIDDRYLLEASIVEISARTTKSIVGMLTVRNEIGFVIPDNKNKYFYDIYVGSGKSLIPMENAKVEVSVNRYDTVKNPRGQIVRFIRDVIDDVDDDANTVLAKNGVITRIPDAVLEEAGRIKDRISKNNYPAPNNFTNRLLVDDRRVMMISNAETASIAFASRTFANESELDIFIPDVAEIIQEGCKLDKFAFNRCFDTGFAGNAGSVFPTELLENRLWFRHGKRRLAVGCRLYLDKEQNITGHEFYEAIIRVEDVIPCKELDKYKTNPNDEFECDFAQSLDTVLILQKMLATNRYLEELRCSSAVNLFGKALYDRFACADIMQARVPMLYRSSGRVGAVVADRFINQCTSLGLSQDLAEKVMQEPYRLYNLLDTVQSRNVKNALQRNFEHAIPQENYSEDALMNYRRGYFDCRVSSPTSSHPDLYNQRILKRIIKKTIGNENVLDSIRTSLPSLVSNYNQAEFRTRRAKEEHDCALRAREIRYLPALEAIVYNITPSGAYVMCKGGAEGLLRFDDYELSDTDMRYTTNDGEEGLLHIGDTVRVAFDWLDMKNRRIIFKLAHTFEEKEG